jgi:hypothetical protein
MLMEKLLFPSDEGRSRRNTIFSRARSVSQGVQRCDSSDNYNPMVARFDGSNHSRGSVKRDLEEGPDARNATRPFEVSVTEKLARLNPYLAKKLAEQEPILLLEMCADGKHELKQMTLRELLLSVQNEAKKIDEDFRLSQLTAESR